MYYEIHRYNNTNNAIAAATTAAAAAAITTTSRISYWSIHIFPDFFNAVFFKVQSNSKPKIVYISSWRQ
jgi:hypothetical protein